MRSETHQCAPQCIGVSKKVGGERGAGQSPRPHHRAGPHTEPTVTFHIRTRPTKPSTGTEMGGSDPKARSSSPKARVSLKAMRWPGFLRVSSTRGRLVALLVAALVVKLGLLALQRHRVGEQCRKGVVAKLMASEPFNCLLPATSDDPPSPALKPPPPPHTHRPPQPPHTHTRCRQLGMGYGALAVRPCSVWRGGQQTGATPMGGGCQRCECMHAHMQHTNTHRHRHTHLHAHTQTHGRESHRQHTRARSHTHTGICTCTQISA